jgi:dTDP-glucose pyrophosphorylase
MSEWRKALIPPTTTIRDALRAIDEASLQIALVVDAEQRLLGTVTDGDVRRGILRGIELDEAVAQVMNTLPTVARSHEDPEDILALMKLKTLRQIPIVDELGRVISVDVIEALIQAPARDNWVVLMAGGLGTRLGSLTADTPKPMLKVGGKPVLETIIENFRHFGFRKFYIAVNFKADVIQSHFGDGSAWDVEIAYLQEQERLGTAGALGLLPERPTAPIFVMNGDLLTKVNFQHLLDFHLEQKANATMCIREYNLQVPYGVVRTQGLRFLGIDEKPVQKFFVNSGVYVLGPEALDRLPPGASDMTALFGTLAEEGFKVCAFPMREYWLDIGHTDDFNRANSEFGQVFG